MYENFITKRIDPINPENKMTIKKIEIYYKTLNNLKDIIKVMKELKDLLASNICLKEQL